VGTNRLDWRAKCRVVLQVTGPFLSTVLCHPTCGAYPVRLTVRAARQTHEAFSPGPVVPLVCSHRQSCSGGSAAKTPVAWRVTQGSNANPGNSKVVYVKDFELEVARRSTDKNSPSGSASDPASGEPAGAASSVPRPPLIPATAAHPADLGLARNNTASGLQAENTPAVPGERPRERRVRSLVKALEKAGYIVHPSELARPAQVGLRIRGVFAEPDEQNAFRRLVVGGDSTTPKMLLYVGVDDLARPEQPLYELANPASSDGKRGSVITVTSFSPVARFEMTKNPGTMTSRKSRQTSCGI